MNVEYKCKQDVGYKKKKRLKKNKNKQVRGEWAQLNKGTIN